MALTGTGQGYKKYESADKKKKETSKVKSGGPGGMISGKAGGLRYGDTQSSMIPKWKPSIPSTGTRPETAMQGSGVDPTWNISPGIGSGGVPGSNGAPGGGVPGPTGGTYTGGGVQTNNSLGSPMTGAGAQYGYTPQGLGMLYDNPGLLAQDVLGQQGVDNYGLSQQLGDALAPALYAYTMQNPNFSQNQDQDVINYIAQYMQQMVTPGGSMPSYDELMSQLMGVSDPTTDLGKQFAMMTPQEQTQFIKEYAQMAAYGVNPLMQRMLGRKFGYDAQQYLGGIAKGNPQGSSYADYLANNLTTTGR